MRRDSGLAEDYINFLRAVLATHGKIEYKVTLSKEALQFQIYTPSNEAVSVFAFATSLPVDGFPRSQKDAMTEKIIEERLHSKGSAIC